MIVSKAFDVECIPNLFSVAFVDVNDYLKVFADCVNDKRKPVTTTSKLSVREIKERLEKVDKKVFVITDKRSSDLLPMASYFNDMNVRDNTRWDLFAFNNKSYDDYMIAAFMMYYNQYDNTTELCKKLYEISKHIIQMQNEDREDIFNDPTLSMLADYKLPYVSIDVMRVFALNKAGVAVNKDTGERTAYGKSLKQTSINLQWYNLLEWNIPPVSDKDRHYYMKNPTYRGFTNEELTNRIAHFDRYIIDEYIDPMIEYNFNDVFIVCEMIRMKIDEIRLRYSISNSYKVNVLSEPRSKIADKLVVKFYSEMSGLRPEKFIKGSTERTALSFKKIIFPHIEFKTPQLKSLLNDMKKVVIYRTNKDAFSREIDFYGTKYTIATGGIHSVDPPRILESTDKYKYVHWD